MAKLFSADLTNKKLCIIEYTTSDGQMLPIKLDAFDATILSHTYTNIGKIIFDKPITIIGEATFRNCEHLTSVTIPDSVKSIGAYAFLGCSNLTEFKGKYASDDGRCLIVDGVLNSFAPAELVEYVIPDSVTNIGDSALSWCSGLSSVTIPPSVTTIGADAFLECWRLTSVTIPDSVTTIEDWAFSGCSGLTTVIIGKGVSVIGEGAFHGCESLTSVTIPNRVTTIEKGAFYECKSLLNIMIGDSVSKIDNEAFWKCPNLKSVTIGHSVSEIGYGAFHRSNIETIVCYPQEPPKLDNSFDKFENLIVPAGCEEAYTNSDWGKYLE